jgi:hypothetical protein
MTDSHLCHDCPSENAPFMVRTQANAYGAYERHFLCSSCLRDRLDATAALQPIDSDQKDTIHHADVRRLEDEST